MTLTNQEIGLERFQAYRSELIGLAYRITGSRAEADDIIQDTFIKWSNIEHQTLISCKAWLIKTVTRMSLDYLKSARVRRVSYIGPWLPEPFISEDSLHCQYFDLENPPLDDNLELDQSISLALMILLEKLSPLERACFILHDIFQYRFDEIASFLQQNTCTCRQLASRARKKIATQNTPNPSSAKQQVNLTRSFFKALREGDTTQLIAHLQENIAFHADGGGKARAATKILYGLDRVLAFLLKVVGPDVFNPQVRNISLNIIWFNGAPGILLDHDQTAQTAFNFELENGLISKIYAHRNPDKLRFFPGVKY